MSLLWHRPSVGCRIATHTKQAGPSTGCATRALCGRAGLLAPQAPHRILLLPSVRCLHGVKCQHSYTLKTKLCDLAAQVSKAARAARRRRAPKATLRSVPCRKRSLGRSRCGGFRSSAVRPCSARHASQWAMGACLRTCAVAPHFLADCSWWWVTAPSLRGMRQSAIAVHLQQPPASALHRA